MFAQQFPPVIFAMIIVASAFLGYYFGPLVSARSHHFYSRLITATILVVAAGFITATAFVYVGVHATQSVIALNIFVDFLAATILIGKKASTDHKTQ